MERLTYRSPLGNAVSYGACEDVKCKVRDCDKCKVGAMICRLCAYEDTGLDVEEYKKHADAIKKLDIEHMHNLLQAEKDGRLVVLPVPVGTNKIAYGITGSDDRPRRIVTIECDYLEKLEIWDNLGRDVVVEVDGWEIGKSDIGKTVFLTRGEAEAALKNMEEA